MPKINRTMATLVVAAVAAVAISYSLEHWSNQRAAAGRNAAKGVVAASNAAATSTTTGSGATAVSAMPTIWAASAPGRVEPSSGEIRIGAQMPGKVAQVLVRMNDTVKAGDLIARLVDDEAQARLVAATTEISVRRRERDAEVALKTQLDRRQADDTVSFSERAVHRARMDLDRIRTMLVIDGKGTAEDVEGQRKTLTETIDKLEQDRANLRRVQGLAGMPLPTRLEASLATARAELTLIETAIEKMRIRAPIDGTILQANTRIGETVAPSAEDVLIVLGDVTSLKVRAEIEERDIGKIRTGQAVVVRSDALPGAEVTGKVERIAQALGSSRISNKGPRRPSDVEVLQVMIDLDGRPPLLPGMRVDVYFKPDATVGAATATKAN